jgi:trimeric autotransporter adhesin
MKHLIISLTILSIIIASKALNAQGIAINSDNSNPDASAMLDVKSTAKGLLIPRMTQAQRNAISNPAAGLMIYQTDNTPGLYYNSGTPAIPAWSTVGSSGGQWQSDGNNIYYLNGNIGIGEANPSGKLHVSVPGDWAGITFTGTGLNDLSVNYSGYSGTGATSYAVRIANAGPNPNLIQYSSDGGTTWSAEVPIAPNLNIGSGVLINFGQTSGHTYNDQWTFTVNQGFMNTLVVVNDKVGIGTSNPAQKLQVENGDGLINGLTIGKGSGSVATNSAFGNNALYSNNTGNLNTANGYQVLYTNTSGWSNTANGAQALFSNTTGVRNTAMGRLVLYSNTTGTANTAVGSNALYNNTTGYSNIAIGSGALFNNTIKSNLVAVGDSALFNNGLVTTEVWRARENTAVGSKALFSNTSGYSNTANGYQALYSNTVGDDNTANGYQALYSNTQGAYNTAIGIAALNQNTGGWYNTAIGKEALVLNKTGLGNTANGGSALFMNNTGNYNTGLGYGAFFYNSDLDNTTCVGYAAGGVVEASNRVEIGNSSVSVIAGQVGWSTYSDERIKDNIKEDVPGLAFIGKLRPVTYNLNIHRENEMVHKGTKRDEDDWEGKYDIEKIKMTGFIAQDVERAAKETGYDFSGVQKPANPDELYSLRYSDFVVPLVKAVQEQQKMIEDLRNQNTELIKRIEILENK